jgi:hypothetical protein
LFCEASRIAMPPTALRVLDALEEARKVLKAMQDDPVAALEQHARVMRMRLMAM